MRKLRLDPEMLRVQSFAAADVAPARGTVGAHEYASDEAGCSEVTCYESASGFADCPVSCDVQLCRLTGPHPTCIH